MIPARELLPGRSTRQVQREVDARHAPRDVVLEERVEPLVADVDLGSERDDDELEIEAGQSIRPCESRERRGLVDQLDQLDLLLCDTENRRDARTLRPLGRVPLTDVETPERVGGHLRPVRRGNPLDGTRQDPVEPLERRGEVSVLPRERERRGRVGRSGKLAAGGSGQLRHGIRRLVEHAGRRGRRRLRAGAVVDLAPSQPTPHPHAPPSVRRAAIRRPGESSPSGALIGRISQRKL